MIAKPRAVEAAEARGHRLRWDPPANELSRMNRMTCTVCFRAVLWSGSTKYGTALEHDCQPEGAPSP